MNAEPLIQMEGINKSFSGNQVLKNVKLSINRGEVHALMGENGAGKSTLIKILTGIHKRDSGSIKKDGKEITISHPKEAEAEGISVIHQELNIIPQLTVMENMFLGKDITYKRTGILKTKEMRTRCLESLQELGVTNISPDETAGNLSVGKQQMIEIARTLSTKAELIVMDEPTAALTDREIESLFQVINKLRNRGVSIIYISHRMEEITRICDRITVLRDGEYIGTEDIKNTSFQQIVKMMVGRELGQRFPEKTNHPGEEILQVKNLTLKNVFHDINFSVRKGEVLGVSGLMGAGRSEIMEVIFGYRKPTGGSVFLEGEKLSIKHPSDAIKAGMGFITEDRKSKGLIVDFSLKDNISLPNLKDISQNGVISAKKEHALIDRLINRLHVKTTGPEQKAKSLSGGNQQKIVIGKWLGIKPKILILDEPTRGVDIGAKKEIYTIMNELAQSGVAIIMVSSELPEILGVSDRIMVIHEGQIAKIFEGSEADQEKIMTAATGGE